MTRTKLCDRSLPDYTQGEERFNTLSHVAGSLFGIFVLLSCLYTAIQSENIWGIVGGAIYGGSMILLYTVSSIYHGLKAPLAKKIMQVLDHCTIYLLIAGTYTPVLLCSIRPLSPIWAWTLFGFVWGLAIIAAIFTAIDLKKYSKFSMACYVGIGWCIVLAAKVLLEAVPLEGVLWLLAGGIVYSIGAVLYGIGKKHRYMHSAFHLFVVIGSVLQYIFIIDYVL